MKSLMVLGCTSDAGKSLLVTALCRWFARNGIRVAPFKAQNMSNNARVVGGVDGVDAASGGEIGVAQWLQAQAAMIEPDVRMNPVLLKPEADTRSQVVVRGVVDRELTNMAWDERHDALWRPMAESYDSLAHEFDLVIIEGAGSPAEINLRDQVNNRMIEYADASGLLVSDIDRGGSFAHLYGTWSLVPEATRARLEGFILNRFRGDAALLAPGPQMLTERTGMACAGVMPMLAHCLPREEGANEFSDASSNAPTVVLPRLPYGSNLDEFHLLAHAAIVRWATRPAAFDHLDPTCDLIVLPGSKHVAADLSWMRSLGIDEAVLAAAHAAYESSACVAGR
jgi:adenosylcobyric acid synthase